jgi:hypothetical protein
LFIFIGGIKALTIPNDVISKWIVVARPKRINLVEWPECKKVMKHD